MRAWEYINAQHKEAIININIIILQYNLSLKKKNHLFVAFKWAPHLRYADG